MEDLYTAIVLKTLSASEALLQVETWPAETEHKLCLCALFNALDKKLENVKNVLGQLENSAPKHECSILFEARAFLAYHSREFDRSQELCSQALRLNPQAVLAGSLLARLALMRSEPRVAVEFYQKILEAYPEHNGYLFYMAYAQYKADNISSAKEYLSRAKGSPRRFVYQALLIFKQNAWLQVFFLVLSLIVLADLSRGIPIYLVSVFLLIGLSRWAARNGDNLIEELLVWLIGIFHVAAWVVLFFFWINWL